MRMIFESEDEIVGFLKAAVSKDTNERVSPLAMITFALSEFQQFEFLRSDLMIRFEGQIAELQDVLDLYKKNVVEHNRRLEEEQKKFLASKAASVKKAKQLPKGKRQ